MVIMLVGMVLRGSAFTFRYYDVGETAQSGPLWTALFRGGSLIVPLVFGHLAAAMSRGSMRAEPTTVWESYLAPWLGAFPATAGLFTVALFGWLASVFLVGERPLDDREPSARRARRWTVIVVLAGAATTAAAALEGVPWLWNLGRKPIVWAAVVTASIGVVLTYRAVAERGTWKARILAGATAAAIVGGYFGAVFPAAVALADGPPLTWPDAAASPATMNALAIALGAGSLLILPGLGWLYRLFAGRAAAAATAADGGQAHPTDEH
jgi:cytochrome d ubiquinol oxidase subunit II